MKEITFLKGQSHNIFTKIKRT